MKIKFSLGTEAGSLTVQREKGDPPAKASGFTKGVHGWGAEIHLLHLIKKVLLAAGFDLACVRLAKDGHMYGDDHMKYLRTPKGHNSPDAPHLWIVDGDYMLRSSSEAYNKGDEVRFNVRGDIFSLVDKPPRQSDWYKKVKDLCDKAGIECELCGDAVISL